MTLESLSDDHDLPVMTLGFSNLVRAAALARVLSEAGLSACADVGQQGVAATVWIDLPEAHRATVRGIILAAAAAIDPDSRRLKLRRRRAVSVRVSAPSAAFAAAPRRSALE